MPPVTTGPIMMADTPQGPGNDSSVLTKTKSKTESVAPEDSALFLGNQLCFALYAASLAMSKTYRPLLAPLGLTFPQYVVMMALWQHDRLAAGALAQAVSLDAGTLVPLVRKLVAQGLLQRERSPEDERSVIVSLTPAGRALQKRAHAVHAQVACATQCSPPERRALTLQLQALRLALTQGTSAPTPPPTPPQETA